MVLPDRITTQHFSFVNYTLISSEDSKMIWEARNNPEISKYMVNTAFIPYDDHVKFVEGLKFQHDKIYYAVYLLENGKLIGSQNINPLHKNGEGESGLFLFPSVQGKGLGKLMKYEFVKYMLDNWLHAVYERVKKDNYINQQLNRSIGFHFIAEDDNYYFFEIHKSDL